LISRTAFGVKEGQQFLQRLRVGRIPKKLTVSPYRHQAFVLQLFQVVRQRGGGHAQFFLNVAYYQSAGMGSQQQTHDFQSRLMAQRRKTIRMEGDVDVFHFHISTIIEIWNQCKCEVDAPSQNLYRNAETPTGLGPYYRVMKVVSLMTAATIAAIGAMLGLGGLTGPQAPPPIQKWQTLEANMRVPPHVETILARACRNCHSSETAWPWYARLAPVGWLMARDVEKARAAMNFSTWSVGAGRKPALAAATLAAACADVRSERMPLAPYRMLHPESRLTKADKQVFCDWANRSSHDLLSRNGAVAQ
jgi:Haem-binding domain